MRAQADSFLELIPEGGSILDLGCGSGRDSLYFLEKDYDVTPLDGSKEMCALAEIHTDVDVLNMRFEDLDFDEVFDGVWACASLVHADKDELPGILKGIRAALKEDGILYMSVKKGNFCGYRNERFFADYHRREIRDIFEDIKGFEVLEIWTSKDSRSDRDNQWINVLAKKI